MEAEEKIPSADRYIDAVFSEHGYLSQAFPNYRPRQGQIALARAVDRAIGRREHLLAEAGTGVGKSLGYSVPASYWAARFGRPVVIVTANIALQEQIFFKDLPLLQSIAPWHFTFSLLKGRNNYLCADRYYTNMANAQFAKPGREPSAEHRRQLPVVEQWAAASIEQGIRLKLGDVSELPFEPQQSVWKLFSVTSEECKGSRCRCADECFALAASERARQAMVIVTNYHMLYAHLAVYLDIGKDVVISPFEIVILDEAHKAADIARDWFGFKITVETIRRLGRKIPETERAQLEIATMQFFFAMGALARNRDRYKSRLTGDYLFEEQRIWGTLHIQLVGVCRTFALQVSTLQQKLRKLGEQGLGLGDDAKESLDRLAEAENLLKRATEATKCLERAMSPTEHTTEVFFVEEDEKKRIAICSKLVVPSLVLGPALFEKQVDQSGPKVAVVATSATLATSEGFGYVASEIGCRNRDELVAASPFDFPNQCLFIAPAGMPDPNTPEFPAAVASAFETIIQLAGGRTLGLFTSHRMLQATFDALIPLCTELDITLLRQGDAPRTKLISLFKEDIESVLLGTESFWAGVDVPGEALSVVVIDRLPFSTPADPVLDVIASRDAEWFQNYSLPRAMIAFKQGFGRLIRSLECRGVVVCLDNRIATKRYGKDFLRAMPAGVPKSTRLEAISEWLYPELPAPQLAPSAGAWDEP
jgi:ATP-dependent DNA helicase DinG